MNIFLADPDSHFVKDIQRSWALRGTVLTVTWEVSQLIPLLRKNTFDLVFIHTDFLVHNSLDIISFIKEVHPKTSIIVLCNPEGISLGTAALSRGAEIYLVKPLNIEILEDAAEKRLIHLQNNSNQRLMEDHVLDSLLGDTPEMRKILKTLYKISPTTSTVLITGESGTGKEFIANVIHRLSQRANEPFIAVNCGAIPENIVESELFGSKKGSFTGAIADKKGLFEAANGGTLFLDEVGELSPATQVKLLRFLQTHEIRRVGETASRHLNIRVLAATNRDLNLALQNGTFREDLYYRLNTFQIKVPPLRERRAVIPRLIKYFSLKYQQDHGKVIKGVQPAAQLALTSYDYPGNIRELENIVEHAIVMTDADEIRLEDLPEALQLKTNYLPPPKETPALLEPQIPAPASHSEKLITLDELEKNYILHALALLNNNKSEVASRLGISRATLWRKLKDHKIED
ncbi:MAG: sigma-54 dependent transcriptional regulator [Fibrobacter sp.]|jgi:DNA-binding NtrC family response regulator|nr:sigma-54 dependent transcriptional regulator [Fibrobacter sp.]